MVVRDRTVCIFGCRPRFGKLRITSKVGSRGLLEERVPELAGVVKCLTCRVKARLKARIVWCCARPRGTFGDMGGILRDSCSKLPVPAEKTARELWNGGNAQ